MDSALIPQIRQTVKPPVGILGLGVEGQSTLRFLKKCGFGGVTVFDKCAPDSLPAGVRYAGEKNYLSGLLKIGTLFRSPGIRPDLPQIKDFTSLDGVLTSQTDLFFKLTNKSRILGVTGTLGKGTCCSLLKAMLDEAGIPCRLGGNIGIPALELLPLPKGAHAILELSSFQLSTLKTPPGASAVLRTTSEHLDWHTSQREYWDHKANIVRRQAPDDFSVYCEDAPGSRWIAAQGAGVRLSYGANSDIEISGKALNWGDMHLKSNSLNLPGDFNLENIAAAAALARRTGACDKAILAGAKSFQGLEHRLEWVGEKDGLKYYNDSYATRPEAATGALNTFRDERAVGLILGGSEKHADFTELAIHIAAQSNIKAIALIGETAPRLEKAILQTGTNNGIDLKVCADLSDALQHLIGEIRRGVILFSPACASFGLFHDYKDRGNKFKALVRKYYN